jgi:hypothetical protein
MTHLHGESASSDAFAELFGVSEPSALDAPLAVSLFKNKSDLGCHEIRTSLRDLAAMVHEPERTEKSALPLLKLATFGTNRAGGKALRNTENLREVWGIEGDHDAGTVSVAEAHQRLDTAGVAALLYETPSSTVEAPRWRVLAPLSAPVSAGERKALVEVLDTALGGCLAPESYTPGQAYYYGRVCGAQGLQSALIDGQHLDLVTGLSALPRTHHSHATEAELLGSIAAGESYHQALTSLVGIWTKRGLDLAECERLAGAAMEAVPESDRGKRWRDRVQDIRRICRDIARREGKAADRLADEFDDLPESSITGTKCRGSRVRLLTPTECADAEARGYIVKGLLAPGDVGCIFGPPGAGKSLLAPLIAYSLAQGRRAFGMRTTGASVFYVAAEDPHGMRGRVKALSQRLGDAPAFRLVEGVSDLLARDSADLAALRRHAEELRPALIVIDTLAMAFPGLEENSADGMGRVVAVARTLTEYRAAVLLVHHDTKSSGGTPRGHSLLNGALDMALQLIPRDEFGVVRAKLTKNRNGSCDRGIAFRIGVESMGVDADGDPITFAVAQELEIDLAARREKLSGAEAAALRVLRTLSADGYPVAVDKWRDTCLTEGAVSAAPEPASRQRAVRRAFEGLARKRYVRIARDLATVLGRDEEPVVWAGSAFDDLEESSISPL